MRMSQVMIVEFEVKPEHRTQFIELCADMRIVPAATTAACNST